ncbi:MAG: S-adenosylmethionine:tRNA ribosyltransferase-isomerase [Archangium sp.]|nr:S-adenosylmethionine:tRNA ribosyltransferase-isomerase [Archangium sp.]
MNALLEVRSLTVLRGEDPHITSLDALPSLLRAGDLLVLNDAATFPGSISFMHEGQQLEVRLFEKIPGGFRAVLFGAGDFHTRTEDRPAPPRLAVGARLQLAPRLQAMISDVDQTSPRLITLNFALTDELLWRAVYAIGKPIQYAHQPKQLPLWSVQNVFSERPWAAETPSAAHHLTFERLSALEKHGVQLATLTHATGLSSTGDEVLDAALPWPERYSIPAETWRRVQKAERVVAVGTSVMRALEAMGVLPDPLPEGDGALSGIATGSIGPETKLQVVDALLTGIHVPGESHYRLLGSLLDEQTLRAATDLSHREGLRGHEFGDVALFERTGH